MKDKLRLMHMNEINQRNVFGSNSVNKQIVKYFTKERRQGFLFGLIMGVIAGLISNYLWELLKHIVIK